MKRALPLIVVLISLSFLGLILLQASWLKSLLELREAQLFSKINSASAQVAVDLAKGNGSVPLIKTPKRLGLGRFNTDILNFPKPLTVCERYSRKEVHDKLKNFFDSNDFKNIHFEFAISDGNEYIEMQSNNFETEYYDTVHNKQLFIPIVPESASDLEGISPFEHLIVIVPDFKKQIWGSLRLIIAGGVVFMLVIFAAFFVTLRTLFNQKKLSEIKSDFINNMTHEFKTPIATISLAVDAIKNEKVQNDKEKLAYFTGIIKEENKRMNKHVETILQAALLEKQQLQLHLVDLHIHDTLHHILDNYGLQLDEKNGKVDLRLNAKNNIVQADEVHFTNLISNLIDNAIKYSNDNVHIKITTHSTNKYFVLSVQDNGIGMSKESAKRIFEKFYRAHTGNVHNVKGFGLGMSYVKTVIDAHKGKVKVDSAIGKGTTFTVEVPFSQA
ncbi:MAG: HAMP domain-containing sensor histidine kinase [Flavobacterium sp.]|nr:HAMP domain-containing sensor histidine kinase [Flavobacterium sp.]